MDQRLKAQIRLGLFRCAAAGDFPTYEEFYSQVKPGKKMGRFPWDKHFDQIAKEERKLGYPDITFVVRLKGKDGKIQYPSRIDSQSAKPLPTAGQLKSLIDGTNKIVLLYCPPGTKNPYTSDGS